MTIEVPQSREAEEGTIGAVLINPDILYEVTTFLTDTDFYIHRNRWIWQAFVKLNEKRIPIDFLTVCDELERAGKLGEVGGAAYLTALASNVYDSNNAEHYGRIVEGCSIRRKMIDAANKTAQLAYSSDNADEALNKAHETLQAITPSNKGNKVSLADRILESVLVAQDAGDVPGIQTGLLPLNTMLGGWRNTDFVIIAARPGMGKTGLLLTACRAALRQGKRAAFFSMEMGDVSIGQRLIAQEKDIDVFNLRRGKLTEDEWVRFNSGIEWIRDAEDSGRLHIFEQTGLTAPQIHSMTKRLYIRDLCDVAFVDYVQLMNGTGETRSAEVGSCSRGLKRIANDLHIPVITAAQLNREIEKRSNSKPVLSDLRESGDLEADADIIIFIWNNSKDGERVANAKVDPAFLTVAKHRNGPVGDLVGRNGAPLVQFVRRSTRFEDV